MHSEPSYQLRSRKEQLARPLSSGLEQAVRDLRRWAERYEAEAHAALHDVFPEWVTPPSEAV
jgi:hypothetical protein